MITGGLPYIPGDSMVEKMDYFRKNLDDIRTAIIHEPRGHHHMIGAVLLPPARDDADFGVFYLDYKGCNSMCGHATIGVCASLVKTGRIEALEPETEIVLDTPAGLVFTRILIEKGEVKEVSLVNVPSFLYADDIKISLFHKEINIDVAFGGNFFTLVKGEDLGLDMVPGNIPDFVHYGRLISAELNRKIEIVHPLQKHIKSNDFVYFYDSPDDAGVNAKSIVVSGAGNVDRSPCGTGTSARMAALFARGELMAGDKFVVEGISGTIFTGKIIGETKVGDFNAVIPEIAANAYITGFHQFIL